MNATDELRRMLDERGVAHSDHYLSTTWRGRNGMKHLAGEPMADGSLVVDMLTPEQAIAATLGGDREAELQKALNKAAGNWARADAGLRKALDFMRIWISEDAHLGESAISREFEKAEGLRKLGAIEDAIDAWNTRAVESANGLVYIPSFRDNGEFPEHIWASQNGEAVAYFRERTCHDTGESRVFQCSECGFGLWDVYMDDETEWDASFCDFPLYCPKCGARVEEK